MTDYTCLEGESRVKAGRSPPEGLGLDAAGHLEKPPQTVVFQTMSRALDSDKSGISHSEQHTARPLLTPDEVRNLPQHVELLFLAGQRPIVAGKLAYYADPEFRGLYDAA